MDQYQFVGPMGTHQFAQTPEELAQRNPDGLMLRGKQLNLESQVAQQQALRGGADERQMAYLQQLQMELARSKMEKEQADLAYNPTMSELGVGGGRPQPLNDAGTLANINQQGGTSSGNFGGAGAKYTNISSADKAYDPSESQATLPPDMRLQDLRRIAENTRHLPNNIQEQILGKLLGVQPESVQRHLERVMAHQAARQDKKDAAEAVVENRKRTFQSTNAASMFNKKTGESLAESDTRDLHPDQIEEDFMFLRPDQRKDKQNFENLKGTIQEYRDLIDEVGYGKPGIGIYGKMADIKARRALGDPTIAKLDAKNAQITQLVRAFGADSRVAVQEMAMMQGAIPTDRESKASALAKIEMLEKLYDKGVKAIGLPWLQKQGGESEDQPAKLSARNQDAISAMSKAEQAGTLPPQQAAIMQELRRRGIIQ